MAELKIDITKAVEEIIEKLNAEGYTEPELAAKVRQMQEKIERLDSENHKLTEKLEEIGTAFNEQVSLVGWYEEREKEYKRLLKAAVEDLEELHSEADCSCNCCKGEKAESCQFIKCWTWRYAAEALKLIGEEQ